MLLHIFPQPSGVAAKTDEFPGFRRLGFSGFLRFGKLATGAGQFNQNGTYMILDSQRKVVALCMLYASFIVKPSL